MSFFSPPLICTDLINFWIGECNWKLPEKNVSLHFSCVFFSDQTKWKRYTVLRLYCSLIHTLEHSDRNKSNTQVRCVTVLNAPTCGLYVATHKPTRCCCFVASPTERYLNEVVGTTLYFAVSRLKMCVSCMWLHSVYLYIPSTLQLCDWRPLVCFAQWCTSSSSLHYLRTPDTAVYWALLLMNCAVDAMQLKIHHMELLCSCCIRD